ncbi:ATPase family protein 2 homolog [Plutella xylostella]|uniref:ATPase family protein 2 homolog n=1 Tax=Plutella xylostella TaxID=51655 RepID=UPI00203285BF|nr:ATPase family protein 2 homolog [Plutella xylostella]
MPPKTKKWVECEVCKCSVLDLQLHKELNCTNDQSKCPYIKDGEFFTCVETIPYPMDGVPRDSIVIHPGASGVINAVIGGPIEIKKHGAPPLLKRMWPSRTLAPTAVVLPLSHLTGLWCDESDNKISVSVYNGPITTAAIVKVKILNHKGKADIAQLLQEHFLNTFVSAQSILPYYYFGKRLEIEVLEVISDNTDDQRSGWYSTNDETKWDVASNNEIKVPKKKQSPLGGVDDILEEINTFIKLSFNKDTSNFQPTRGVLLYGSSGAGKTALCKYITETTNCYSTEINGSSIFSKYMGETESSVKDVFIKAKENAPSIIVVDEIETVCPKRTANSLEQEKRISSAFVNLIDELHQENCRVFILATTRKPEAVEPSLRRFGRLDKEIEIPIPDRIRRREILYSLLKKLPHRIPEKEIESVSQLAHGYVAADLVNLCTQASMKCIKRSGEMIETEDIVAALTVVRPSAMRELLIEIPNVRWSDIGGQDNLKLKLRQAVEWPLKHADSFQRLGIRPPSGVLLYGPPGCSKTMIAKALATESGLNFLSIKGPELLSKYVGESERAVRNLFTKARQVAPSVIFFDEVDALGGERGGKQSNSEMVLAQLLTELDGVVPLNSVTILAATNRPDRIDRALLRPGRLDRLIYVPLPDFETRLQIVELKLSKMSVSDDVNSHVIATKTDGFSGAELEAVCHEAALNALETDINCKEVTMQYFENVLKDFKPRTPHDLLKIYDEFALGQKSG